jgi:hypothetical protein
MTPDLISREKAVEAIDAQYGYGAGRKVTAAARAMHEAVDGPDAAANASASTRAHWNWLATLSLSAAAALPAERPSDAEGEKLEPVAVKPLEWGSISDGGFVEWRAASVLGEYRVFNTSSPGWALHFDVWLGDNMCRGGFKTAPDGMAAAQADYELRIRASLQPSPTKTGVADGQ